ncbi:Copia protein [Eumeta japonica]|uniref:Copia protein n=1 Tax=Eumeta variegata TaxID=151549 RepID=A0A4C2AHQ6_EUMVA|nr:Copia protein [Eumeta japonica]
MAGGLSENNEISNKISIILDSGASDHIINREDLTHNFTDLEKPLMISIAKNGVSITATKKGTLKVRSALGINGTLQDVLYCPDIPYNLLSVRKMQQAGFTIIFEQNGNVQIQDQRGNQLADIFTKPLAGPKFIEMREKLGLSA